MKSKQVQWPICVRTSRLEIRPYGLGDYPAWVESFALASPKKNRFDMGPRTRKWLSKKRYRGMLRVHRDLAKADRGYVFGIFERKTGRVLGWIDFYVYDRGYRQFANFGYLLHNQFWRQGYGGEAVRAMIPIAFRKLKLHRLEIAILPDNKASLALAQSVGFKRECKRRRSDWNGKGWESEWLFTALPEDFGMKSRAPEVKRM